MSTSEGAENGGPSSQDADGTTAGAETNDDGSLPDFGNCDLEAFANEIAAASSKPVVDCGYVDKADDLSAWQQAQLCVLDAIDVESPFKLLYQPATIDSVTYAAFVGAFDITYSFHELIWRLDEDGNAELTHYTHPDLAPGCEVEVGDLCLHSGGTIDMEVLCP